MGGACGLARGDTALGYPECAGNCLGILFINGFALGKPLVVLVGQGNGADLGTFATTCAFCQIYKTGLLQDAGGKIARIALKIEKFRVG